MSTTSTTPGATSDGAPTPLDARESFQQLLTPDAAAYALTLYEAGLTIHLPAPAPYEVANGRIRHRGRFHYSRVIETGRECFGTFDEGDNLTPAHHTMPIEPSRLNGSSAHIGGKWGDAPTLGIDTLDPYSVAMALIVARPSNWCPYNAEPTQDALNRANGNAGVPQKYYKGARLEGADPRRHGAYLTFTMDPAQLRDARAERAADEVMGRHASHTERLTASHARTIAVTAARLALIEAESLHRLTEALG